nr:unnamed protein product [Haemonchus contortus]
MRRQGVAHNKHSRVIQQEFDSGSLAGTPEAVLRRDIYRTAGHIVLYKRARKLFPFPLFSFNKNVICKART